MNIDITSPAKVEDLMERYGMTRESLAQMRYKGTGPTFFKAGKRVYYRWADVLEWEASNVKQRTGEES